MYPDSHSEPTIHQTKDWITQTPHDERINENPSILDDKPTSASTTMRNNDEGNTKIMNMDTWTSTQSQNLAEVQQYIQDNTSASSSTTVTWSGDPTIQPMSIDSDES